MSQVNHSEEMGADVNRVHLQRCLKTSSAITDSCQRLCLVVRLERGLTHPDSVLGRSPWAPQRGLGAALQWGFARVMHRPRQSITGEKGPAFCRLAGLRLSYEEQSRVGQLVIDS